MRTNKKTKTIENETKAIFSKIPLEKLAGLEESLWPEQFSLKKNKVKKLKKKCQEESQDG